MTFLNFGLYNLCNMCFSADKSRISVTKTHGDLVVNSTKEMQRKEILGGEKCPVESWKGRGGLSESLRVISQTRGKYRRRVRTGGCIYTAEPNGDTLKTLGSSLGLCC